jgi:chromate transporter
MTQPSASAALVGHIAFLSLISFGGVPGVLPDLRQFVVEAHGWLSDRDFLDCFAIVQAIPGPNMILLMSFLGWKLGGIGTALAGAVAAFGPTCAIAFVAYRMWDRFRDSAWHHRVRRGLAPVTIGLMIAGGYVMARPTEASIAGVALSLLAAGLVLRSRLNPMWLIAAGGTLGACGIL